MENQLANELLHQKSAVIKWMKGDPPPSRRPQVERTGTFAATVYHLAERPGVWAITDLSNASTFITHGKTLGQELEAVARSDSEGRITIYARYLGPLEKLSQELEVKS